MTVARLQRYVLFLSSLNYTIVYHIVIVMVYLVYGYPPLSPMIIQRRCGCIRYKSIRDVACIGYGSAT